MPTKEEKLALERERTEKMKVFEHKYEPFYAHIGGIDEVGRGPFAGPVYAACVILPRGVEILYLNDSKKLSAKKRDELYDVIMEKAVAVGIGYREAARIDEINILNATKEAMKDAVDSMKIRPDFLLIDSVSLPDIPIDQFSTDKGDALSVSIAAASIVAKVTRDRLMDEYDRLYPGYGFSRNKGYGTAEHIRALKELGPCALHRRTFISKYV
ncbi:MAG: ribonuclease HII [Lachnospiraceae bacterium]|nr:ribonuclease HII [Lachnospiraceae bacterium]